MRSLWEHWTEHGWKYEAVCIGIVLVWMVCKL